jgi:hypothetical protein
MRAADASRTAAATYKSGLAVSRRSGESCTLWRRPAAVATESRRQFREILQLVAEGMEKLAVVSAHIAASPLA